MIVSNPGLTHDICRSSLFSRHPDTGLKEVMTFSQLSLISLNQNRGDDKHCTVYAHCVRLLSKFGASTTHDTNST